MSALATQGRFRLSPTNENLLVPDYFLPAFKHPSFTDRITHAAKAKAALASRFKDRPGPDDPAVRAKAAARLSIHEARLARQADRQRAKDEDLARQAEAQRLRAEQAEADELARLVQAEADAAAAQQARRDRLAAAAANMADGKALRDQRYAARKARQKR